MKKNIFWIFRNVYHFYITVFNMLVSNSDGRKSRQSSVMFSEDRDGNISTATATAAVEYYDFMDQPLMSSTVTAEIHTSSTKKKMMKKRLDQDPTTPGPSPKHNNLTNKDTTSAHVDDLDFETDIGHGHLSRISSARSNQLLRDHCTSRERVRRKRKEGLLHTKNLPSSQGQRVRYSNTA